MNSCREVLVSEYPDSKFTIRFSPIFDCSINTVYLSAARWMCCQVRLGVANSLARRKP